MPKVGNSIPISQIRCSRCNSKRRISKKWTEKIPNSNGFMVLEHTEFMCTNKECQKEFEKIMAAEEEKREKLKQIKLEDAARRSAKATT